MSETLHIPRDVAEKAIKALMRIVGEEHGFVVETTILGVKDDEETQKKAEALG